MNTFDEFSLFYAEMLEGDYDCVDRMVLNAYFPLGQTGGGLRNWWRQLRGDDSTLDDAHLRDIAGTFTRRLDAFCNKWSIPIIEAQADERKHKLAETYLPSDPTFSGLFLVIPRSAAALVREVKHNTQGHNTQVQHRKHWPYVKHYYFHLIDPGQGHVTIRMCVYPPFGAQVILNSHEQFEREAARMQTTITKSGNCFIEGSDFNAINRLALGLNCAPAIEHLRNVCERWIYSSALVFALRSHEQLSILCFSWS